LNIAALEHRLRLSEDRAEELEQAVGGESRLNSHEEVNALQQRLFAVEDRARLSETNLRKSELRLATTEDQLRSVRDQSSTAQEQLRATAKELANRRAQIIQLRERLARRLILPFGKMQRRIEELTS
jgi:septal ring factor EnvC (AmiA/AmiB activator)